MGKQRRGRSERTGIGYLTEGKIEDMARHLNTRDVEILKTIYKFKYINTEQLLELIPEVEGFSSFKSIATGKNRLNKRLRVLFDSHFICKDSPQLPYGEGTSLQYCWLDRAGHYVVNGTIEKKVRDTLPQDYLHYSAITDTFIYFRKLHMSDEDIFIKYIRMEQQLQTLSLIPDITVIFNVSNTPLPVLIEIDRCYKNEKNEAEKIHRYFLWKESYAWRQEEWAKIIKNCPFPKIIYLVDDNRKYWQQRVNRIKKSISAYNIDINFIPYSNMGNILPILFRDQINLPS